MEKRLPTKTTRNKAQTTITLKSAGDVSEYLGNLPCLIATKVLEMQGWYGCVLNGSKTLFIVEEK